MDDPPKAHRCVQAGKMPAIPGEHRVLCPGGPAASVPIPGEPGLVTGDGGI